MLDGLLFIPGPITVTDMSTTPFERRQRPRPIVPTGPPWKLVSPFGLLHIIHDGAAMGTFIAAEDLGKFNVEHLLGHLHVQNHP